MGILSGYPRACRAGLLALVCGAAVCASLQASAQTTPPPSIEAFFDTTPVGTPRLSPSGAHLAVIDHSGDTDIVHIIDTKTLTTQSAVNTGLEELAAVQWISDDRLLAKGRMNMTFRLGSMGTVGLPTMQTVAMDRDGSDAKVLLSDKDYDFTLNKGNVVSTLPGEPRAILLTATRNRRPRLIHVDTYSGETREIETGREHTSRWMTSETGEPLVRFDASPRGKWVKIRTRAPGSKKWKTLVKVRAEDVESLSPIGPTDDPKVWYIAGRGPGEDLSAVWLYDLETNTFLEKIMGHESADVRRTFSDASGRFVGASFVADRREHSFVDTDTAKHMAALHAFAGKDNEIVFVDASDSGSHWLVHVSGPRDPGTFVLYDREATHAQVVHSVNTAIRADQLSKTEVVTYPTRDGDTITAYLTRPSKAGGGVAPGRAPTVVLPHGGPILRDDYGYDIHAQFLASRGYAVLQPNFRGSTGRGLAFQTAGYREWGGRMLDDIQDGVAHLAKAGRLDPERVGIMGLSYGGYAALMSPIRYPDTYSCAVSINGVTDLVEMMDHDRDAFGRKSEDYAAMLETLGDPGSEEAKLRTHSPALRAAKLDIPVLLIAGESDVRVPPEQSEAMAEALRKAGGDVRHVAYPNANHSLYGVHPAQLDTDDREDDDDLYAHKAMMAEAEAFFGRCLPTN